MGHGIGGLVHRLVRLALSTSFVVTGVAHSVGAICYGFEAKSTAIGKAKELMDAGPGVPVFS